MDLTFLYNINISSLQTIHVLKTYCASIVPQNITGDVISPEVDSTDAPEVYDIGELEYIEFDDLLDSNNTNLTVTPEIITGILQQAAETYYTTTMAGIGIICTVVASMLLRCDLAAGMRHTTFCLLQTLFVFEVSVQMFLYVS